MLEKSSDILYLFDFDGTLFGRNDWVNLKVNNRAVKNNGPFINPTKLGIRWRVLTGRPRIDKFFVWRHCHMHGLHPEQILMYKTLFYPKGLPGEHFHDYKVSVMKDILDGVKILNDKTLKIKRIFYMDNDIPTVSYINAHRNNYPLQAMTVVDFKKEEFNYLI